MEDMRQLVARTWRSGKTTKECRDLLLDLYQEKAMSLRQIQQVYKDCRDAQSAGATGAEIVDQIVDKRRKVKVRRRIVRGADNVGRVQALIEDDARRSLGELAQQLGLAKSTVWRILRDDLGMTKKSARWVPRILTPEMKQRRVDCANDFLRQLAHQRYKIVTSDETWIHYCTPETKEQSKEWRKKGASLPVKAKICASKNKIMATAFFDATGAIYTAYGKATINSARYISTLRQMRKILRRKRPALAQAEEGLLYHHDNAPAHTAQATVAYLNANNYKMVAHPPYSPDLAPADFFLFPKMKKYLAGMRHDTLAQVKASVQQFYASLTPDDWRNCFDQWVRRLEKCVDLEGDYVEK